MMPNAGDRLALHLPYIVPALARGEIDTPKRIAAWAAQAAHESGEYRYMKEIASGAAYEGRADLGNTEPGDGERFPGRCPFQITGRANYKACGDAIGVDLIAHPEKLEEPQWATKGAVWFWNSRSLSLLADVDWFKTMTRVINGGYNGLSDRRQYWDRDRALLGLPMVDLDTETGRVKAFQSEHGLVPDGVVGRATMAALA